jgi:outer membrane protein OmpA-like peptidoglycan-associated protein
MKNFSLSLLFAFCTSIALLAQNGLKADFYDGTNFYRQVGTKIESEINYYWDRYPPFEGMTPNECSVRWTGRLMSPKTEDITFLAMFDDGVRIWLGGNLIIDNWQLNDVGYAKKTIKMKAGEYYDIKIEYFNALHEAELKLFWLFPKPDDLSWYESFWYTEEPEIIPAKYFFQPVKEPVVVVEKEEETPPKLVTPPKSKPKPKPKPITAKKKPSPPTKPQVTEVAKIESYIPENVQFERAKTEILPESFAELDRLADFLIKNPQHKIKIEGHTDNVGDAQKNFQLSHSRARAVAAYLIKKGVHHERLSAEGFGGARPLVKSDGKKYHPENRRVEFIVE